MTNDPNLPPQLNKFLNQAKSKKDLEQLLFLIEHPEYEHPPVTMKEFLTNPLYTPAEDNRRKHTQDVLVDIFDTGSFEKMGDFEEILYIAGIGSGKSFMYSLAAKYILYRLLCLKNPQKYYRLGLGTRIAFINISKSYSQAKDVVFGEFKNRIDNSPWFQKYYPPDSKIKSVLRFPKNLYVLPVGSNEEAPLGYNIFSAAIDEASFHISTKDKDYAQESYNQIKKRIRSRFLEHGKLFIITSPRYVHDFAEKKFREDDNPKLYKRRTPLWEALPAEYFSGVKFDATKYLPQYEGKGIMIPVEYEQDFKQNPDRAMRDFGAQPSMSIQGFFRDSEIIPAMANNDRKHPIDLRDNSFFEWFKNPKSSQNYDPERRYIHVDLGLNRDGTGDAAGIAMGKFNGWQIFRQVDGRIEKRPKIYIDFMEQIKAGPKGEILFSDIRKKIYALRDMGYNIELVTFDGWNSVDSIQTLKDAGFRADILSVDKSLQPYYTLKAALLEGRLDYYKYPPLISELQQLEEVSGKKIDHPHNGSKDTADAVAGVCYHVGKRTPGSGVLGA